MGTHIVDRLFEADQYCAQPDLGRVMQFWDDQYVLATRMAKDAREPQPVQRCCVQNNHLWDLAAVYRPGVTWDDVMPTAVVFNGPVLQVRDEIVTGMDAK